MSGSSSTAPAGATGDIKLDMSDDEGQEESSEVRMMNESNHIAPLIIFNFAIVMTFAQTAKNQAIWGQLIGITVYSS